METTPHEPTRSFRFDKLQSLPGTQVTVIVDCVPDVQAVAGYALQRGLNKITIFNADLPVLKAMVRPAGDADLYEQAKQKNERNILKAIAEELAGETDADVVSSVTKRMRATWSGSPEACFTADHDRDLLPLLSLEVIEANVPPPRDEIAHSRDQSMASENAAAIAVAVAAALKPLFDPLVAALQAAAGNTKAK